MDDIKLLYITSKIRALISINQSPVGETGEGAITQIASGTNFFISMAPLENEKNFAYLPYTRKISTVSPGSVSANDGLAEICFWPGNIIEITLNPLIVYKNDYSEFLPSVISPYDFTVKAEKYTAYVYNEVFSSLAVENSEAKRLAFFCPLPFSVLSADISLEKTGESPFLIAAGETAEKKRFVYAAKTSPVFSTAVCTLCESYRAGGGKIEVVKEGIYMQEKTVYEMRDNGLFEVSSEPGWFTSGEKRPSSPDEVIKTLVQAVASGSAHTAMRCLTPSLGEGLSFGDLKEFFGDYIRVVDTINPACVRGSIALKYAAGKNVYTAREFCVDTKPLRDTFLIDNIREP